MPLSDSVTHNFYLTCLLLIYIVSVLFTKGILCHVLTVSVSLFFKENHLEYKLQAN